MEQIKTPMGFHRVNLKLEPFEPFGFRNREDTSAGRFFFINRKQDRFTLVCNYREHGVNLNGKKYGHFKRLFSLTFTLRKPKTSKHMSMNVFYSGNVGGRRYNLLNITRNSSLVFGAFPTELNTFIISELLELVERQHYCTVDELAEIKNNIDVSVKVQSYTSLILIALTSYFAFPILKNDVNPHRKGLQSVNILTNSNNFSAHLPPVFATPLLRLPNVDSLAGYLKIDAKNKELFKNNIDKINLDALYYLSISRGLLDCDSQNKMINKFVKDDPAIESFKVSVHNWDSNLTGNYIPKIRQVLKKLDKVSSNNILGDANFMSYVPKILSVWMSTSKFERSFKIEDINNVKQLHEHIIEEINGKKVVLLEGFKTEIDKLVSKFNDGVIFNKQGFSDADLSGSFGRMQVWMFTEPENNGMYNTSFYYGEVHKTSPLWKTIFEDEQFVSNYNDAAGFSKRSVKPSGREVNIRFTPKIYLNFLQTLDSIVTKLMKQYDIENNKTNYAFVALTVLCFSSYSINFKNFKIPKKIFTLYKAGLDSTVIEYALKKKISEKTAVEYAGLPLEWVEKLVGAREGTFTNRRSFRY